MRYYWTDHYGNIRSRAYVQHRPEPIVRDFVQVETNGHKTTVQIIVPDHIPVEELTVPQEETCLKS